MPLTTATAFRKDTTSGQGATLEHRHFAFIAATLKSTKPGNGNYEGAEDFRGQWADDVKAFADACARSNPRFNRKRFLAACDYED